MIEHPSGLAGPPRQGPGSAAWGSWREALAIVLVPTNLRSTLTVAVLVGTILVGINQGDTLLQGQTSLGLLVKVLLTYLVPFLVSNYGVLVVTRRRAPRA